MRWRQKLMLLALLAMLALLIEVLLRLPPPLFLRPRLAPVRLHLPVVLRPSRMLWIVVVAITCPVTPVAVASSAGHRVQARLKHTQGIHARASNAAHGRPNLCRHPRRAQRANQPADEKGPA